MSTIETETEHTLQAPAEIAAVETPATYYFYFISAKFSRKLPSPIETIKHFDGGFQRNVTEFATGESFNAGTFGLPASETVGKFDILSRAMDVALLNINKSRRAAGEELMFRMEDMLVISFDGGRNAL